MVGKGSVAHNRRAFIAENVNKERTGDNVILQDEKLKDVYHKLFDKSLEEYNTRQTRSDRKIADYYEHIRKSKQEKLFHEVILQIGNKDNMHASSEDGQLAKQLLIEYVSSFEERNPNLRVFFSTIHMDEQTPHLHIDFLPYTTGSKRGLETRVSLKKALAAQGFTGGSRGNSEWSQWINHEKEQLALVMERHGIEWEHKHTHEKHLFVVDYKLQERTKELTQVEQKLEAINEKQIDIDKIEEITPQKKMLSSKITLEKEEYEYLSDTAKKYVVAEKKESSSQKWIDKAKSVILGLQKKIQELEKTIKELLPFKEQFAILKRSYDRLYKENQKLKGKNKEYRQTLEKSGLIKKKSHELER